MSNDTSAARRRIDALVDNASFVEIGAKATARSTDFCADKKSAASDGVITGYGVIDEKLVYVYSQDASVLKGTMGEMHAKKIVNLYKLAMKTGAPVIALIDSAGLRLEEASDGLNGFGEIFMAQTQASGVIPQITGVFGMCGGGMAIVSALSDFTFMEETKAKLFVNAPNALKGNHESECDTASASYQSEETGLADIVGSEEEIIAQMRELISILPANNEFDLSMTECTDSLNRTCSGLKEAYEDPALMLPKISDDYAYFEIKPDYACDMVTAFIRLNGATVGVAANRSAIYDAEGNARLFDCSISPKGAKKAADFVNFCDAFSIPVVTFTNAKGFYASKGSEADIAPAVAKMVSVFANATVPKVSVITGEAFGSAYLVMNSKSIGADMVFAWSSAKLGVMEAKAAAKILCDGSDAAAVKATAKQYDEVYNNIESAARRGYVDTVIEAEDTRKYLIGALDMLYSKREIRPDKKHTSI